MGVERLTDRLEEGGAPVLAMAPAAGHLIGRDDPDRIAAGMVVFGEDREETIVMAVVFDGSRTRWLVLGRRAAGQLGRRRCREEDELALAGISSQ
jgi:hypothetical protein